MIGQHAVAELVRVRRELPKSHDFGYSRFTHAHCGLTEARYLCRRLRDQHPAAKIVVGRWGRGKDPKTAQSLLLSAGADRVAATLREARTHLARLLQPVPLASGHRCGAGQPTDPRGDG